jgi:organic radical activating enzyme
VIRRRKKPLGKFSPWVWSVEFVRGCNLKCWHCTARIFPEDGQPRFMSLETWEAMCRVMETITPSGRLELAQGGEPTLHPHLIKCLRIARRLTPSTQVQVTTNGVTILAGKVTYKQLFDAGANSVYVDMYGPVEKHLELARASGVAWYKYDKPKTEASSPEHRMANTFYGDPSMKLIILQDHPEYRLRWRKMGRLSTFLNHIDWNVAMPYGLVPVREPYARKCTLPMRYSSVSWEGDYLFCCSDFWCESGGQLGNVKDGPAGFTKYWCGRLMQSIRRRLIVGDRAGIPYCSRCNCAFSKCDWVKMWPHEFYRSWWDGKAWQPMPPQERDDEVFADGWKIARRLAIPTQEQEDECLAASGKRIIKSTAATKRKFCVIDEKGERNGEAG